VEVPEPVNLVIAIIVVFTGLGFLAWLWPAGSSL